jgi:hypothetical protein
VAHNKSGKVSRCPDGDVKSGLCCPHALELSETANTIGDEEPNWKNIVQKVDPATGVDAVKQILVKMPNVVDINKAHG